MKNILISGASGFLGTEIIRQLLKLENKVLALSSNKINIQTKFGESVSCYSNDDLLKGDVDLTDIDVVLHCAFARAHKGGAEIAKSMLFTTNFFDLIKENNIPALINISTQEVYGNTEDVRTELMPAKPTSIYGTAKYFTELYAIDKVASTNTVIANIRLAGLIGIGADTRMVSKFIDSAIINEPINILDGDLLFSQLDVRDAASGIIALIDTPLSKWENTYNLGYKQSYSIQEIAETVKQVAAEYNMTVKINKEPSDAKLHVELDSKLLYNDTNWTPEYNMEKVVRSIFEYKINTI